MSKPDENWIRRMAELEEAAGGFPGFTGHGRTPEQIEIDKTYIKYIVSLLPHDEVKKEVISFFDTRSPYNESDREQFFKSETITAAHEIARHWINFVGLGWRKSNCPDATILSGPHLTPEVMSDQYDEWKRRYDAGRISLLANIAVDENGINRLLELLCSNILLVLKDKPILLPDHLELVLVNNIVIVRKINA